MFIKISIVHLYGQIFRKRWFRMTTYLLMALSVMYSVSATLEIFLVCQPLAFSWNTSIPGGHCGNLKKAWLAVAVANLLIDLAIVLLPLPVLWGLQMNTKRKLALSGIFSIGVM